MLAGILTSYWSVTDEMIHVILSELVLSEVEGAKNLACGSQQPFLFFYSWFKSSLGR